MERVDVKQISNAIRELSSQALSSFSPPDPAWEVARAGYMRPINYMRCAEFYALSRELIIEPGMRILDISSPQWFSLFLAREYPEAYFDYTNMLDHELDPYKSIYQACEINNLIYHKEDVRALSFDANTFDKVISISVIEHISPEVGGDYKALQEIKRVLKHNGEFILTVPYKNKRNIVYVDGEVYERGSKKRNFYAREYDEKMFNNLVSDSGFHKKRVRFISEKPGLFSLDYYEWGPGKTFALGRYVAKSIRIVERAMKMSLHELLAKYYLRVSPRIEYRVVNIAASLNIGE